MNRVQEWASRRLTTLRGCGLGNLTPLDMTDDRLADVPRVLSDDERDRACEQELMGHRLRISALEARGVRLDTTTGSRYADVNEEGLLQWGHSKDHRPDLPHITMALATLDPFGVPLASDVHSEEQADDPVSVPLIDRVHQGLERAGLLYVGDGKMADENTRAHLQAQGDVSLGPLSALPVPLATLAQYVEAALAAGSPLIQVVREDEVGQPKRIAQGSETLVEMEVVERDRTVCWQERRLIIQSIDGSLAAQSSVQERLEKAEKAICSLMVRTPGTPRLTSRIQADEQVQAILSSLRVEGLLQVSIQEEVQEHPVRAYRGKRSSPRQIWSFQVHAQRNPEAIERAMNLLGWRVSATNQHTGALAAPNGLAHLDGRSRASEATQTSTFPTPAARAVPGTRRGMSIPASHGVLSPLDDLLRMCGMLPAEGTAHDPALDRFGPVQPGTADRRGERHHSLIKKPPDQIR
jgi:hypothetical protein